MAGIGWFVKLMFVSPSCALKVSGFSFDLLGQPITAHVGMPRSIHAHAQY